MITVTRERTNEGKPAMKQRRHDSTREYRSARPNPFGWFLVVAGGLGIVAVLLSLVLGQGTTVSAPGFWIIWLFVGAFSLVMVVSGVRLLRP